MNKAWIGLGALVIVTLSCGGQVIEPGASSAAASTGAGDPCTPGQQLACSCPGGGMGAQTCRDDGSGFEPCLGCDATSSASSASSGAGGASMSSTSSGASSTSGGGCTTDPAEDADLDGWTLNMGDCNDCDGAVNPGAIELGGNMLDDDCDGLLDNVAPLCDQGLLLADNDPLHAAQAVELCKVANGVKDWGVISAKWVSPDGSAPPVNASYDLGHGLLGGFGPNVHVQAGQRMLVLSSGTARQPTDSGYKPVNGFSKGYTSAQPAGFPEQEPACPGIVTGTPHDAAGLEISLRAPSNVHGFSFDLNHFTYEWPGFICSANGDVFLALLSPIPAGLANGNISFDPQGNHVGTNSSFLQVCGCAGGPPCMWNGQVVCTLGGAGLVGTGFQAVDGDHGSSGWLTSAAPILPGQSFTIRWTEFDSNDGALDSTVLIDHWRWIVNPGVQVGTTRIQAPN